MLFAVFTQRGTKYGRIVTQSFFPQKTLVLSFELIMQQTSHDIKTIFTILVYCVNSLVKRRFEEAH